MSTRTQKMDPKEVYTRYISEYLPAHALLGQSSLIVQSGFVLDYVYTPSPGPNLSGKGVHT